MTLTGPYREQMEARLPGCEVRIGEALGAPDRSDPQGLQEHAEQQEVLLAPKDILPGKPEELDLACADTCKGVSAAAVHARLVLQEVFDRARARSQ